MQLTTITTAQWQQVLADQAVLRILGYTGDVITMQNGQYRWSVAHRDQITGYVKEVDWGLVDTEREARDIVENVIRDHHKGPSVVGVESGTNYLRAEFHDGTSVVMDTSDGGGA